MIVFIIIYCKEYLLYNYYRWSVVKEDKAIFIIDILKNIINVYFDTFFVLYFFQVANYEIVPLVKYYVVLYLAIGIGFILIRKSMK